jgi:hypothetical protein
MNNPLMLELQLHEYLRTQILETYQDIDDETLIDTLEGLTDINDKVAAVVRSQQEDRVSAEALKIRIQEMQERKSRFEARVATKREMVATVMDRATIKKIEQPDFTVSVRSTAPGLEVLDEDAIPKDYWRPQPAKLDRKKLLKELGQHCAIPGVCLGNGGTTVSVRVR